MHGSERTDAFLRVDDNERGLRFEAPRAKLNPQRHAARAQGYPNPTGC